jgi:Fibronectin type III domain
MFFLRIVYIKFYLHYFASTNTFFTSNIFSMKKALFFLTLFLPLMFGFSESQMVCMDCPAPTNLQLISQTSSSVTFSWTGNGSAAEYRIRYTRQEDNYTSSDYFTTNSCYTFDGLAKGHYRVYVAKYCGALVSSYDIWYDVAQS